MDVECSQHAIEELDNELFNYGTYLSEKIVQYTKESGFTEIQKEVQGRLSCLNTLLFLAGILY